MRHRRIFYTGEIGPKQRVLLGCCIPATDYAGESGSELVSLEIGPVWSRVVYEDWVQSIAVSNIADDDCFHTLNNPDRLIYKGGSTGPSLAVPKPDRGYGGELTRLRWIDGRLYVCGSGGQFYSQDSDQTWHLVHPDVLIPRDAGMQRDFLDLDGPRSDEIYLVGAGGCMTWDGRSLAHIETVADTLTELLVEDEGKVWMCGWHGRLLKGNMRDGFDAIPNRRGNQMFLSVAHHAGTIFLGSADHLYMYDGKSIVRVETGLEPEPRISIVRGNKEALWGFGETGVIRHADGKWEHIALDAAWANSPR